MFLFLSLDGATVSVNVKQIAIFISIQFSLFSIHFFSLYKKCTTLYSGKLYTNRTLLQRQQQQHQFDCLRVSRQCRHCSLIHSLSYCCAYAHIWEDPSCSQCPSLFHYPPAIDSLLYNCTFFALHLIQEKSCNSNSLSKAEYSLCRHQIAKPTQIVSLSHFLLLLNVCCGCQTNGYRSFFHLLTRSLLHLLRSNCTCNFKPLQGKYAAFFPFPVFQLAFHF